MKYRAAILQIPTALIVAKYLIIDKFVAGSIPLLALAVFKFAIVFVVHRLMKQQTAVTIAGSDIEEELRTYLRGFYPKFP